jgi:hypothetical protein
MIGEGKDMKVLSNFRMALCLAHGKILDMTKRITLITEGFDKLR